MNERQRNKGSKVGNSIRGDTSMKSWSRLGLFFILSCQFLLSGCDLSGISQPPSLFVSRVADETHECLNNSHNSYVYWTTRLEFQKYFRDDWNVGDTVISPITFPLFFLFRGLPPGLWETIWLPVDMPREMEYQSRCVEWKAEAEARDRHYYETSRKQLDDYFQEKSALETALQTASGQADVSDIFIVKGLPIPAALPTENLDQSAANMAQEISKSDEQSLPVLLAALQTAGFSIIDENGTVLWKPSGGRGGQGLGFYDFEAVGSLKLETLGVNVSLEKLAGAITKGIQEISASQFSELILRDLRTQASNSSNAYLRFWARLIIELGKASTEPVDLMTASSSQVKLSVLQTSLLLRRLQGDMNTLKIQLGQTGLMQSPFPHRDLLHSALWKSSNVPLAQLVADSSINSLPCHLTNDEALILDGAANALTYGNGKLMELLKKINIAGGGETLGQLSKSVNITNAVYSWAKLVAAVTMLRGKITVDNPPLVRTLDYTPGQKRLMTATFWYEVGKAQLLNCFRTALNISTGLDFNLPTDGPVADAAVGWHFSSNKEARFVRFESPPGNDRNPSNQMTDNKGNSKMWLVGAPKIPAAVSLKNPKKITKTANVLVDIALKSSKDFWQNLIDIGGVASSGPILGSVAGVAEIGFRLPYVMARAAIPVIDLEPSPGYRPIKNDSFIFSGVICSLATPFTVTGSGYTMVVTYNFVPSLPTSGTWSYTGTMTGLPMQLSGGGTYTIEKGDSDTPRISTVGDKGPGRLDLEPLETDECQNAK